MTSISSAIDELTEADLRELGLTLGQRKRFLRARAAPRGLAPPGQRPGSPQVAASAGERRQLTSMFCDLVASTPLSLRTRSRGFQRSHPGFSGHLRRRHHARVRICRPLSRRRRLGPFRLSDGARGRRAKRGARGAGYRRQHQSAAHPRRGAAKRSGWGRNGAGRGGRRVQRQRSSAGAVDRRRNAQSRSQAGGRCRFGRDRHLGSHAKTL